MILRVWGCPRTSLYVHDSRLLVFSALSPRRSRPRKRRPSPSAAAVAKGTCPHTLTNIPPHTNRHTHRHRHMHIHKQIHTRKHSQIHSTPASARKSKADDAKEEEGVVEEEEVCVCVCAYVCFVETSGGSSVDSHVYTHAHHSIEGVAQEAKARRQQDPQPLRQKAESIGDDTHTNK